MSDVPADDHRWITPDRFWGFWRLLLQRPFEWFFRMRVYGAENVPRTGPAVIACNHIAGIDVVVLGAASPRTLRYMAKAELFWFPLGWIVSACGAFRVRRGEQDEEAIATAIDLARAGSVVVMFPEGTRRQKGLRKRREARWRTGAARIALRAD